MAFPKNFLWGVATSAAQIEGGAQEDGRTPSIWDHMAQKPGAIFNNQTPAVACDSYHRYKDDVAAMADLGLNSYRFSISWSRVMPQGTGALNPKGVDYYKRLLDELAKHSIRPNVTLYHWDLPQILEDKGGWKNRDAIEWFGEYAYNMYRELGDMVPMWATVNEPIATYIGYGCGGFAPGHTNKLWGNQARHNLLVAHGKAVEAFRSFGFKDSQIGIVIDIWKRHALTDSPEDQRLVMEEDEDNWKFYTDAVFAGKHSDYILNKLASEGTLMDIKDGDMALCSTPIDFYGMNIYNRVVVSQNQQAILDYQKGGNFIQTSEFYPKAVYDAAHLIKDLYGFTKPIYITENGFCSLGPETVDPQSGRIEDDYRIKYLDGFLHWTEKAIDEGIDIRGYFIWSIMDNFEWTAGYNYNVGLMQTNYETLERIPKKSYDWYKNFIKEHK